MITATVTAGRSSPRLATSVATSTRQAPLAKASARATARLAEQSPCSSSAANVRGTGTPRARAINVSASRSFVSSARTHFAVLFPAQNTNTRSSLAATFFTAAISVSPFFSAVAIRASASTSRGNFFSRRLLAQSTRLCSIPATVLPTRPTETRAGGGAPDPGPPTAMSSASRRTAGGKVALNRSVWRPTRKSRAAPPANDACGDTRGAGGGTPQASPRQISATCGAKPMSTI